MPPGLDPGFVGPEVQYLEHGAAAPAVIPAAPAPIFTVDVTLGGAHPGDRFEFFLLDYVAVWTFNKGGAFSTQGPTNTLDTGGDSVPDGTDSIYGLDPDVAVTVPPASYLVDFIDGQARLGGASIEVIVNGGSITGRDATGPVTRRKANGWSFREGQARAVSSSSD